MSDEQFAALKALLASFDEWLGNDEGLMITDVIEWRDMLAKALGAKDHELFQPPARP